MGVILDSKRKTIGLLLDNLRGGYNFEFWEALSDYCNEQEINLLILPGSPTTRNKAFGYQHKIIYEFIREIEFDGLIYLTNALCNFSPLDEIQNLKNRFSNIPSIAINIDLEGVVNTIYNDNVQGIEEVMEHLIVEHGFKDIAFIKGLDEHKDAVIRLETYKKMLEKYQIECREDYILDGDFFVQSGRDAVDELIDVRDLRPEAIVAANDDMAVGAIQALRRHDIRVPEDIKVVGYDNIKEVQFLESPLTTVRQPLKEMAIKAVDHLMAYINGEQIERYTRLDPDFILRTSCGCKDIFRGKEQNNEEGSTLGYHRIDENRTREQFMIDSLYSIGQSTTYDALSKAVIEELPKLGVDTCFVNLYEGDSVTSSLNDPYAMHLPEVSTMLFGYQKGTSWVSEPQSFETGKLIPSQVQVEDRVYTLIIEPLLFGDDAYGFWVYELGMKLGGLYETIRRHICSAIHTIRLLEERNRANKALESALHNLEETKDQLVQAEKMASLSTMVAGVAHEINTPVGVAVSAASHLKLKARELERDYINGGIKKSSFESFLKVSIESTGILVTNLLKASDLIKSFKNVSADQMSEQPRKFFVKDYLEQIQLSLAPQMKKLKASIRIQCDDSIEIDSYPGAFSQIITNLVLNSLLHGYEEVQGGIIDIEVQVDNINMNIIYRDYGKGIQPEALNKIFDPFYTTKRGQGGSGLGLHIVYNIVKETFKGAIACSSEVGKGTTFNISFPIDTLQENDEIYCVSP